MVAVTVMGCSSQSAFSPSIKFVPTSSSPTSSALPQVGSIVNSSTVFAGSYNWFEYQSATTKGSNNGIVLDMKVERSVGTYQGRPAIHCKITTTTPDASYGNFYDAYYDPSTNSMLGGTMTIETNGYKMTVNIPPSQMPVTGITDFEKTSPVIYAGTENVSVPSGSYPNASKYIRSMNEATESYWAVSGIPIPVKMVSSSPNETITSELMGWG